LNVLRALLLAAGLTSVPAAVADMLSLPPQTSGEIDFREWLQLNKFGKPDDTNYETEFQSPCDDPTNTDPDCLTNRLVKEPNTGGQG
jgi:hypothetical protein